ncbi:MAG: sigma-54-dependent transcriptional regulator [Solirubrobacterales bacterium]
MAVLNNFKILIVDDEIQYQDVFKMILEENGYFAKAVSSGMEALKILESENFNLVLTDLRMEGMDGLNLLENIKKLSKYTEVIIVTGYGTIENAVNAIKKGAFSYFIKSRDPEELILEIEKLKRIHELEIDNKALIKAQNDFNYLLTTKSKKFQSVLNVINKAADSNVSIFITGESGVGKEVMARYIHQKSFRKNRRFLAVNCQTLSENLLESELFGHEKGSFTGANDKRTGKFEEAHGGTLFLDEIGEIPVNIQTKLLRVLETRTIERVGSNKPINIDIRLISATNRDIQKSIKSGYFREDLYYRLNTIIIEIPPLRQRREDIPDLIHFFLRKCEKEQKKRILSMDNEVKDFLLNYNYPGNIRELRNIVERLVVLSENGHISSMDLPDYKSQETLEYAAENVLHGLDSKELPFDSIATLKDYKRNFEADYIKKVLDKCAGNMTEASRLLGISRRQLFNKVIEYNLK